ncbi:hypothetical protein [uncultured Devosia sp.]|uniref:hypothetical protein n=1 Tax=uncultured Devosia sp. TaxID=211434 RepID=UPI00261A2EE5|nr:hypothetical protein [uncultured Devosia sp.]
MSAVREKRDIEWLVNWALEKQCIWTDTGDSRGLPGVSSSTPLARMMAMGTVVQSSSAPQGIRWSHPDAMVIGTAIEGMWGHAEISDLVALVVQHGRQGSRPDWGKDGIGRYALVTKGNGKVVRRYADQVRQRGLMGFEFEFVGLTHEEVEAMMIAYAGWWETLVALKSRVNPLLTKFEATGPSAQQWPWDHYAESVIHYPKGASKAG